ncbi:MAG TPA: ATP-binding protein [Holophagaceae bacterium]|nr:ATP-binding protein [Holophagaceae bacterium]
MLPAFGVVLAGLFLAPLPGPTRALGIQVLGLLLGALTLTLGLRRARREPGARALGFLLAGFGALSCLYRVELLQHLFAQGTGMAVHPLRDALLWILALGLLLGALVALNRIDPGAGRLRARMLDALIFSLSFYLLLWMGLVRPWLNASAVPPAFSISSQLLFAITAAALGLALHTLLRQGSLQGPAAPLAAALATLAIVFPWSLAASFHQSYPLDHPARFLSILAFMGVLHAVATPLAPPRPGPAARWVDLLPYGPAALAFLGFFVNVLSPNPSRDPEALALVGLLAILVLGRQGLTLLEVDELNLTLEQKVEQRTRELADREALILKTQNMNLLATLGAGLAHDLNNLIGGASMQAEYILTSRPGDEDPRLVRDLQLLMASLDRAGVLTNRLMDVGRAEEPVRPLDLEAHLRGMAPMLRALVPRAHPLDLELAPGRCTVACAPSQLDQIIVNLVVNARDALGPSGRIRVAVAEAPARREGGPSGVLLTVEDTGSGIPDAVLQHIFEPFFTTKAPGQGTGLGLGSVKAVVEGLGGEIQLRTKAGEGTRFSIWLPLAAASTSAA